jgi:hypothetical protein
MKHRADRGDVGGRGFESHPVHLLNYI